MRNYIALLLSTIILFSCSANKVEIDLFELNAPTPGGYGTGKNFVVSIENTTLDCRVTFAPGREDNLDYGVIVYGYTADLSDRDSVVTNNPKTELHIPITKFGRRMYLEVAAVSILGQRSCFKETVDIPPLKDFISLLPPCIEDASESRILFKAPMTKHPVINIMNSFIEVSNTQNFSSENIRLTSFGPTNDRVYILENHISERVLWARTVSEDTNGNIAYSSPIPVPTSTSLIDLSKDETANCYMASPNGVYKFKPRKGNSSDDISDIESVEILWESKLNDINIEKHSLISPANYSDGYIKFMTCNYPGNAVIAARDKEGTIIWSWHIWITEPIEDQVYYYGSGTYMDRNLGATDKIDNPGAFGLYYQRGRKDPFLGVGNNNFYFDQPPYPRPEMATSTTQWNLNITNISDYDYATKHPTSLLVDWQEGTLTKQKSINDPCPPGYRLPTFSECWIVIDKNPNSGVEDKSNQGMQFGKIFGPDEDIWYPASGFIWKEDYYTITDHWLLLSNYCLPGNRVFCNSLELFKKGSVIQYYYKEGAGYPVRCIRTDNTDVLLPPTE